MKAYKGKWSSEHGQTIRILPIPFSNSLIAIYRPTKGRVRILRCIKDTVGLRMPLHILTWLEAMLIVKLSTDSVTGEQVLVPEIEQGPETDWMADDLGFPWVFPLGIFKRV